MSADYLTPILGLIGTITGVLALLISYRTYASAKPKLNVTVKKCEHLYDKLTQEKSEKIIINSQLSISNVGDRRTTLNETEIQFVHDGKNYAFKKEFKRTVYDDDNNELGFSKVSIDPHETINEYLYFDGLVEGNEQEKIACGFKIFHTHGEYSFKATSERLVTRHERV